MGGKVTIHELLEGTVRIPDRFQRGDAPYWIKVEVVSINNKRAGEYDIKEVTVKDDSTNATVVFSLFNNHDDIREGDSIYCSSIKTKTFRGDLQLSARKGSKLDITKGGSGGGGSGWTGSSQDNSSSRQPIKIDRPPEPKIEPPSPRLVEMAWSKNDVDCLFNSLKAIGEYLPKLKDSIDSVKTAITTLHGAVVSQLKINAGIEDSEPDSEPEDPRDAELRKLYEDDIENGRI